MSVGNATRIFLHFEVILFDSAPNFAFVFLQGVWTNFVSIDIELPIQCRRWLVNLVILGRFLFWWYPDWRTVVVLLCFYCNVHCDMAMIHNPPLYMYYRINSYSMGTVYVIRLEGIQKLCPNRYFGGTGSAFVVRLMNFRGTSTSDKILTMHAWMSIIRIS